MSSNFGISALSQVFQKSSSQVRRRVILIYSVLISYNVAAWLLAFIAFRSDPKLLLLAFTAYTFGLRHAFDADHISAIDNVTRKLMQEGQRPVGVGLFFSLGHSTIVVFLTILIALAALAVSSFDVLKSIGGLVGTAVSALFLLIIAAINIVILVDVFRTFREVKNGGEFNEFTLDESLNKRGLMGRFFRPLLKMTNRSWKMYPIGLLFGLGFDTATEVGLLGIAATTAGHIPILAILLFPALFTAGMTLMDTTDSVLMLGAYGWAFVKPIRKLYYNLNITLISVIVALVVGGLEALSIIASELNLSGPFWDQVNILTSGDSFGRIGFLIVGLFLASWLISTIIYKVKRYDDIEVNVTSRPGGAAGAGGGE
ncbi:MAG TPA: HoxN/HupN/NixA family nickel/cobalt transporter [Ktedonobacteraceae bacterium]|jgi:high-affinity nickel-transport protein|nr:HoxN/HupN/NixA family nickel/cobalt transporter [Ktedonobacteraceae bacterium]